MISKIYLSSKEEVKLSTVKQLLNDVWIWCAHGNSSYISILHNVINKEPTCLRPKCIGKYWAICDCLGVSITQMLKQECL